MTALASTIISGSTVLKLIVGALVAGLGVMVAFTALIYCAERAVSLRRADQRATALLFQAASAIALSMVLALVTYGLILTISKPK